MGVSRFEWSNKRRLIAVLVAGALLIPPGIMLADYRRAIATASLYAQGHAMLLARARFHNLEYRQRRRESLLSVRFEAPPSSSAYRHDPNAVHAKIRSRWKPLAGFLIGGPYVIEASATATVLVGADGRSMVLAVE